MDHTVCKNKGYTRPVWRAVFLLVAVLLGGCMVGPKYQTPPAPVTEEYRASGYRQISGDPVDPRTWWCVFKDPTLNQLIDCAYAQNLDVQAAGVRVVEARSENSAQWWLYFPIPTGSASVARSKSSQNMKPDVNVSLPPSLQALAGKELVQVGLVPYLNTYSMSTAAMWEPDIWGKNTRRYRSGKAMVDVAVADLHGALVSLSAEMANNYVLYRTYSQQRSRLQDDVGLLEEALKAAEARQGDLHDADVALARTLLADTRSKIPPLEAGQRQAENAMCVLLAIPPQDLKPMLGSSIRIPGAPKAVCAGVPADLLRRRPDVRRAESECAAQCEKIGLAKARIYPSFSLVGLVGYKSTLSSKLTDPNSWTGAISGGVDITGLLGYPVTKELQRIESERFQALVFGYQQAVLNAVREVENAATAFAKSQDQLGIVSGGAKSAKDASVASIKQYKDGKADFTYVLNSYQYLVSQQDQEAKVRGQVALNLVAMYRALGGGWETDRPREVVTEQTKKDLKQNAEFRSFNGERRFEPICPTAPPPATR